MDGLRSLPLTSLQDDRGELVEIHRASWLPDVDLVQWNVVRTVGHALRGVHCHLRHTDYLTVLEGSMCLGLCDLRPGSATEGKGRFIELAARSRAVLIPPGIAHGFYFREPAVLMYGVTHEWDPADELGCRFDDPELPLAWPCTDPLLSPRDRDAGSLSELRHAVRARFAPTSS